jgi:hypothetical protein
MALKIKVVKTGENKKIILFESDFFKSNRINKSGGKL